MSNDRIKLVVLICEEALENIVLPELLAAGAKGYSICEARGRGIRGVRDARWLLSSNVRIELLCEVVVARGLIKLIEEKYSTNYGLIVYMVDAEVSNPDNF